MNNSSDIINVIPKFRQNEIDMNGINYNEVKYNHVINPSQDILKEKRLAYQFKIFILKNIGIVNYIKYKIYPSKLSTENDLIRKVDKLACFETIVSSETIVSTNNNFLSMIDFQSDLDSFVTINNNYVFKSITGGVFSLIYISLIIPVILFIGNNYFYKINPKITSFSSSYNSKNSNFSYYFNQVDFNYIVYYNNSLFNDMLIINTNIDPQQEIAPEKYQCTNNDLSYLFNITEIKSSNIYNCHNKNSLFFESEAGIVMLLYQHKCLNPEMNCEIPEGLFDVGIRLNFTKPVFNNYKDFLQNTTVNLDLHTKILSFPFYFVSLQINIFKNDIGVFEEKYEEFPYIWKILHYSGRSGQISLPGTIENYIRLVSLTMIYTRRYKSFTELINESFSLLVLISAILKVLSNFFSNFYCEKYLFELMSHNAKVIEDSNSSIKYSIDDSKFIALPNKFVPLEIRKDDLNTIKVVGDFNCVDINKQTKNYILSIWDYSLNLIPFTNIA